MRHTDTDVSRFCSVAVNPVMVVPAQRGPPLFIHQEGSNLAAGVVTVLGITEAARETANRVFQLPLCHPRIVNGVLLPLALAPDSNPLAFWRNGRAWPSSRDKWPRGEHRQWLAPRLGGLLCLLCRRRVRLCLARPKTRPEGFVVLWFVAVKCHRSKSARRGR